MVTKWDRGTDVLVAGYGLAGATAAIAAHDAGARVILLEKLPVPGGNSILAGGTLIWSTNKTDAVKYLQACSGGRTGQDLIEYMAQGLVELPDYLFRLAEEVDAVAAKSEASWLQYPFPGKEGFKTIRVMGFKDQEGVQQFVYTTDMRKRSKAVRRSGESLMHMMYRLVEKRGIEVMLSTAAKWLVKNETGRIVGMVVERSGREIAMKAGKGVILACGGFEYNEWLLKQYCEIQPIYGVGCQGNTGDGILMSQKAGAALWHMWLLHGSYGFKFPGFKYAFRVPFGGALNPKEPAKVAWILVNRGGKRFMNEATPFLQDSSYRNMQSMNTDFLSTRSGVPQYDHIPCYLIFDEDSRKEGPVGWPLTNLEEEKYEWSQDNSAEIEKGWIKKAGSPGELARTIGLDPEGLEQTIERWNRQCTRGEDTDFHRIPGSMVPIKTPPFYAIESWPIVTNTQGGPQFNTRCQIVDAYGDPIPGLYKAGELGSFFGHLYSLGGNLSECVIEGRTAGENAACERGF